MKQLEVMNFLNEVANDFPEAISLAAGRPNPQFFCREKWEQYTQIFIQHFASIHNLSINEANQRLCEYGPASGLINGLISEHLAIDEDIMVSAEDIIITNGCQEALTLVCLNELVNENDCMLVIDPSYIGFSGLVNAIGKRVFPIDAKQLMSGREEVAGGLDLVFFQQQLDALIQSGLNPKAIYINPDFNNPLGYQFSKTARINLLDFCHQYDIKIVEDNPYVRFNYSDWVIPSIKSLDKYNLVYHIGSFSKTFSPSVRLGYLVMPTNDVINRKNCIALKSLISVNTTSTSQSIIGGFLLENKMSLTSSMKSINRQYKKQRDALCIAVDKYFEKFSEMVKWEKPEGGFFIVVELPFSVNHQDVFECVKNYGVIFMPVSFFALAPELWSNKIRLSFSYYTPEKITEGIRRLALFLSEWLEAHDKCKISNRDILLS